jgi:hypothetical protein
MVRLRFLRVVERSEFGRMLVSSNGSGFSPSMKGKFERIHSLSASLGSSMQETEA